MKLCGAKKRQAPGTCGMAAGWGTPHPGTGPCRKHGGNTSSHIKAAANAVAVQLGGELDVDPHEALLWCVRISAGQVAYWRGEVARLEEHQVVGAVVTTVDRPLKLQKGAESAKERVKELRHGEPAVHIAVNALSIAVRDLARFSKMALDAGVAERQVKLAERYGDMIATLLAGVLEDLQLTAGQQKRAPEVVRLHLARLEGGLAA